MSDLTGPLNNDDVADDGCYVRPSSEYSRPSRLVSLRTQKGGSSEYSLSGVFRYNDILMTFTDNQELDLELVPEPGNPWDSHAVSVEVNERRVGYLPASTAADWHDPLRFLNNLGYAAYFPGQVRFSKRGYPWVYVQVPGDEALCRLAKSVGVFAQCDRLLARLQPQLQEALVSDKEEITEEIAAELEGYKQFAPELNWSSDMSLSPYERLPQSVVMRVENLARSRKRYLRDLAAEARKKETAEREAARLSQRTERMTARVKLREAVAVATEAGQSQSMMASRFGCSARKIASLQKEAGVAPRAMR